MSAKLAVVFLVQSVYCQSQLIRISFNNTTSTIASPTLYGLNQFIGSIDNLTYSNPAVVKALNIFTFGQLRYPGGSPSNYWSYIDGDYINCTDPNCNDYDQYQKQIEKFPARTFDAIHFNNLSTTNLIDSIMWDFNVVTIDQDTIKDTIKYMLDNNLNFKYLELGNEIDHTKYDWKFPNTPDPTTYMQQMIPIINYTRSISPNTRIAVVGTSKNNLDRLKNLTKYQTLFDAITIHEYYDGKDFVDQYNSNMNLTVAVAYGKYYAKWISEQVESIFTQNRNLKIWMTEFNFAHKSSQNGGYPVSNQYIHGTVHAAYWIGRIIESINRHNIEILDLMCMSFEVGISYGQTSAILEFNPYSTENDGQIRIDGVAQIYAHFAYLTINTQSYQSVIDNNTFADINMFGYNVTCIQCGVFIKDAGNALVYAVINNCNDEYELQLNGNGYNNINITIYYGIDGQNGEWTNLLDVDNVEVYPWNQPIKPFFESVTVKESMKLVIHPYDIMFAVLY